MGRWRFRHPLRPQQRSSRRACSFPSPGGPPRGLRTKFPECSAPPHTVHRPARTFSARPWSIRRRRRWNLPSPRMAWDNLDLFRVEYERDHPLGGLQSSSPRGNYSSITKRARETRAVHRLSGALSGKCGSGSREGLRDGVGIYSSTSSGGRGRSACAWSRTSPTPSTCSSPPRRGPPAPAALGVGCSLTPPPSRGSVSRPPPTS